MSGRKTNAEYVMAYTERHPIRKMLRSAAVRARKHNLKFNLTEEDIIIPEVCPILGIKLQFRLGEGKGGKPNSPSLDRLDNSKGYIKGNIQVISHQANGMKSFATKSELLKFADWINKTYG